MHVLMKAMFDLVQHYPYVQQLRVPPRKPPRPLTFAKIPIPVRMVLRVRLTLTKSSIANAKDTFMVLIAKSHWVSCIQVIRFLLKLRVFWEPFGPIFFIWTNTRFSVPLKKLEFQGITAEQKRLGESKKLWRQIFLLMYFTAPDSDTGHYSENSKMDCDIQMEDHGHDLSPSISRTSAMKILSSLLTTQRLTRNGLSSTRRK